VSGLLSAYLLIAVFVVFFHWDDCPFGEAFLAGLCWPWGLLKAGYRTLNRLRVGARNREKA
jgi:hypothetical protein